MTDQNPTVTDEDRKLARSWAWHVEADPDAWTERLRTAARVILVDIPAPAPRTLADMTREERAECRRMQAEVKGYEDRAVIIQPYWKDGSARVMWATSRVEAVSWAHITPRPDLPRLTWPGEQQPAPTALALPEGWKLADHQTHGRVVVTNSTPDPVGAVYFVAPSPDPTGNDWHGCDPTELTYPTTPAAPPPNTITLGSTWNNTDTLAHACNNSGRDQITVTDTNGYAFIWAHDAEWWEGSAQPTDAPFTIIHTGKEAEK